MYDLLLDDNGDLLIKDGDLQIGHAYEQTVELLVASSQGSWVDNPLGGVGVLNYLNAPMNLPTQDLLRKEIQKQLEIDGHARANVDITTNNGKIQDVVINGN